MRKIVFIHLLNDRSGSPKVLSQVVRTLTNKGYQTEVITSNHTNGFLDNVAHKNRTLFYKRSENKIVTFFNYMISQIFLFFQCLRYWNQDVVFYVNTMMPFGSALAAKLIGKKVIYHIHETSIKPKILKKFLRTVISLTANKVIFVSEYLKQVENFINKEQVVIYNALEKNNLEYNKTENKNFVILMICSLKEYKGIFEYIKLADLLSKEENLKFQLILNATKNEINEYLGDIKKTPNLVIFDRQNNLEKFYKEGKLLLNLSKPDQCIETFGLTILEGMEYGLPVIVPPIGGPAEIVREGIEGFQISCYEIKEIAEKIKFLLDNQKKYNKLSQNAEKRSKEFNLKVFEEKILDILVDI